MCGQITRGISTLQQLTMREPDLTCISLLSAGTRTATTASEPRGGRGVVRGAAIWIGRRPRARVDAREQRTVDFVGRDEPQPILVAAAVAMTCTDSAAFANTGY